MCTYVQDAAVVQQYTNGVGTRAVADHDVVRGSSRVLRFRGYTYHMDGFELSVGLMPYMRSPHKPLQIVVTATYCKK